MSEPRSDEICDQCGAPALVIRLIRTNGYNAGVTWRLSLCAEHGNDLPGVNLICDERLRQIKKEGWTAEHDDSHAGKEIAWNGRDVLQSYINGPGHFSPSPGNDPWGLGAKNNKNPLRCLVIAGALIAAEIDRLLREQSQIANRNSKISP